MIGQPSTNRREPSASPSLARARLATMAWLHAFACAVIAARVVTLEWSSGDERRAEAVKPLTRAVIEAAPRGRIIAADGTVLAHDVPGTALTVHYRWFEEPINAGWLRRQARARVPRKQWRDRAALQAAEDQVRLQRADLHEQLAQLAGLAPAELQARFRAIQRRVERIVDDVRRGRQQRAEGRDAPADDEGSWSWWRAGLGALRDLLEPREVYDPDEPIVVAEQLDYHRVVDRLPIEAIAEIEGDAARFAGCRLVSRTDRVYPANSLAAHLLGYGVRRATGPGATAESILSGVTGLERYYDALLAGREAKMIETSDRNGRLIERRVEQTALPGRDLTITLDVALQRTAEALLDEALSRGSSSSSARRAAPQGGAVVAIDVTTGGILCAASAPRFDPNLLSRGDASAWSDVNADRRKPLVDRTIKMALPAGSTLKVATAIALQSSAEFDPRQPLECQGYWQQPDRLRCQLYRHQGIGHGPTTLADALMRSCNVYFFEHASEQGLEPLVTWMARLGFGRATGIDLPGESSGRLPAMPGDQQTPRLTTGDQRAVAQALAIGQGEMTATPMQMACLMATVANGGHRVQPHFLRGVAPRAVAADGNGADLSQSTDEEQALAALMRIDGSGEPIAELDPAWLIEIRRGLQRVVADTDGTAHETVYLDTVSIAGKTGTAETGGGRADHAWFAGYAPANRPRVAVVVVLEHGGSGAEAAGPLARRMVSRLSGLGYLGVHDQAARDEMRR